MALYRAALSCLIAALILLPFVTASAHPNHGASWGERYLKLDIGENHLRCVYGLTIDAKSGRQIRDRANLNGNNEIDEQEASAFGALFIERLEADVALSIDDNEVELDWARPFAMGLIGRLGRGPVALETTAEVPLAPGDHRLRFIDRAEFDGIYRTTATLAVAAATKLLTAGRHENPSRVDTRIVFLDLPNAGQAPPRRLFADIVTPGASSSPGQSQENFAFLVLGALLLIAIVGLQLRRRRIDERG